MKAHYAFALWVQLFTAPLSAAEAASEGQALSVTAAVEPLSETTETLEAESVTIRGARLGVTGIRMNVPLKHIPATVNTLSTKQLREQGRTDWDQALASAPGVYANQHYGGFSTLSLRGLSTRNMVLLKNGARDDAWLMSTSSPISDLSVLDRIEVLRGPNAVLYGQGALAGAVNLVFNQPERNHSGELRLGMGEHGAYSQGLGQDLLLGSAMAARLDIGHSHLEGWRKNGKSLVHFAATFDWELSPSTTLRLFVDRSDNHWKGDVGLPLNPTATIKEKGHLVAYGANLQDNYNSRHDRLLSKDEVYSLELKHALTPQLKLRGRLAAVNLVADWKSSEAFTLTWTAGTAAGSLPNAVLMDVFAFQHNRRPLEQSLELEGDMDWGLRQQFLLGGELNLFRNHTDSRFVGQRAAVLVLGRPWDGVVDQETTTPFTTRRQQKVQTVSVYGQDLLHLTDWAKALLGARYTDFRRSDTSDTLVAGEISAHGAPVDFAAAEPSYRAGLVLEPLSWLNIYSGWSTAFLPPTVVSADGKRLRSESGSQIETGLRLAGRYGSVNVAHYYIDKSDTIERSNAAGPALYENTGGQFSRGAELEASLLLPAGFGLSGGYGYTDARWKDYVRNGVALHGRRVPAVPQSAGNAWMTWRSTRGWGLGLGLRYTASIYKDFVEEVGVPEYYLGDAALFYRGGGYELVLNVKNFANHRDYFVSTVPNIMPGAPREASLSLVRNW